ncbi:MAG: L,D-transpeptidase [Myxococcales bacterium]|nr:L,D-transpeptidase [Myxococcales bacterium]
MKTPSRIKYGIVRRIGDSMNNSAKWQSSSTIVSILVTGAISVYVGTTSEAYADPVSTSAPLDHTQPILLKNPGFDGWKPEFPGERQRWQTTPSSGYTHLAIPRHFLLPIFDSTEKPRKIIGRVRRGSALSVRAANAECFSRNKPGKWYEVKGGGVLCNTSGFDIVKRASPLNPPQRQPKIRATIPFEYARVTKSGSARLRRKPTLAQWKRLTSVNGPKNDPTGLMIERMVGDFFVSIDKEVIIEGERFMRTVRNEFVAAEDLKIKDPPIIRGERLRGNKTLPMAFVYGDDHTEILCEETRKVCGLAEKYARFPPQGLVKVNGSSYVRTPSGYLVPKTAVRIARKRRRPKNIAIDAKWIHVNLAHQNIVAYEGSRPVYVGLIASGKEGYDTPTGLYQVQRKYIAKTMRAVDPKEGLYHIEDIPYIQYYHGGYALHGAFWHNGFGNVRSHGCTNLPSADARWLFYWANPDVPEGWQSLENINRGTPIYFTNKASRSS